MNEKNLEGIKTESRKLFLAKKSPASPTIAVAPVSHQVTVILVKPPRPNAYTRSICPNFRYHSRRNLPLALVLSNTTREFVAFGSEFIRTLLEAIFGFSSQENYLLSLA
jgi:hypothetical protein